MGLVAPQMWSLPGAGVKPVSTALGRWTLNHWTIREVLKLFFSNLIFFLPPHWPFNFIFEAGHLKQNLTLSISLSIIYHPTCQELTHVKCEIYLWFLSLGQWLPSARSRTHQWGPGLSGDISSSSYASLPLGSRCPSQPSPHCPNDPSKSDADSPCGSSLLRCPRCRKPSGSREAWGCYQIAVPPPSPSLPASCPSSQLPRHILLPHLNSLLAVTKCYRFYLLGSASLFFVAIKVGLYSGLFRSSQVAVVVKNPSANAGEIRDFGLIPVLGRPPGGGHGNPLQPSCLENSMDRGAWWATVHGVTKSRT